AITRVPLKPVALSEDEAKHLRESFDDLDLFRAVDLYTHNVVSREGLLQVLAEVQQLNGFGLPEHGRAGQYSLLMVDVAIFWQLLRLYYSYSGMAAVRQDQLLLFGFWHPYHYAHVALWNEFRHTFLTPIFFALFPEEKRRPPSHSRVHSW